MSIASFFSGPRQLFTGVLLTLLWQCIAVHAQLLPHSHYKYQVALAVCQKIAAARGDVRQMPLLEVNSKQSNQQVIAQFKPFPQPRIILDEKLYDVSTHFGADSLHALACIVGHELAHFYENHGWGNSFAEMTGVAQDDNIAFSKTEKSLLEAEADYFGLFYGFLAGYETFRVLPKILSSIYQEYQLPEQLQGYPSRQERLSIAEGKVRELTPLLYAFNAGKLLYLRKNYDEAAHCFDYILSKYPGREVFNNAGVTRLAQALALMEVEVVYFAYPFELDAHTRLRRSNARTTGNASGKQQQVRHLLSQAQDYFEKAIDIDRSYPAAYINLACTYSLQDNQAAAIGTINELEKVCQELKEALPGNAHLIRGIARVKEDQLEKAEPDFEQAVEKEAYQARYNQELYQKMYTTWHDQVSDWITHWPVVEGWIRSFWQPSKDNPVLKPEKINESMIPVKAVASSEEAAVMVISDPDHPVKITATSTETMDQCQLQLADYTLLTTLTTSGYAGATSLGITIGSDEAEVIEKYGEPTYRVAGSGTWHYAYYESARIIFTIDEQEVKGWWIYTIVY